MSSKNKNFRSNIFIIISMVITTILLIIFYKVEGKAENPIIPFDIFTQTSTIVNLISFLTSAIFIGSNVYLPIYIQNILGFSAKVSGLALTPMSIAWLIASVTLGKCIAKHGSKVVILISNVILLISTILLLTLRINSPLSVVLIYVFIIGFGLGGALTTLTITVQDSVEYNKRGAATATNSLFKTIGQTIGISVFGSVFNLYIIKYFTQLGINGIDPSNLYKSSAYNVTVTSEQIKLSLNSSLHILFIILIIISILCLILSLVIPKGKEEDKTTKQAIKIID